MYVCMYVCLSVCLSVCMYVCMYVCIRSSDCACRIYRAFWWFGLEDTTPLSTINFQQNMLVFSGVPTQTISYLAKR